MSLLCGGLYVVWFPGLNQVSDALEIEQVSGLCGVSMFY